MKKRYNPKFFRLVSWLLKLVYREHNIVMGMSEFDNTSNFIARYTFLDHTSACGTTFGMCTQVLDLIGEDEELGTEIFLSHLNKYFKEKK